MFRMSMLPALDGDCLLLTWGDGSERRHAVVDGGRAATYAALRARLEAVAADREPLELLVLTHVDADHVAGSLRQVEDPRPPLAPKRVWYNSFESLGGFRTRSMAQGDRYARAIARTGWSWNEGFAEGLVSVATAAPVDCVPGLRIRVLGPDRAGVEAMRSAWAVWRAQRIAPGQAKAGRLGRSEMPAVLDVEELARPGKTDVEAPNGSSIALMMEYEGRRVLLAGDAHPDALVRSLAPLAAAEGGRVRVDVLKVPHHGSAKNVTRELVELLDCRRFAFSTDGTRHGHPDPEAVARILAFAPPGRRELLFNYRTDRTGPWDDHGLMARWDYVCVYGEPDGCLLLDV